MATSKTQLNGSRATLGELLAEVEQIYEELETLVEAERRQQGGWQAAGYPSWEASYEHAVQLAEGRRRVAESVRGIVREARDCLRRVDFWYPNQERSFQLAFGEDVLTLLPEPEADVSLADWVFPFLRGLRRLLLSATAVSEIGADLTDGARPRASGPSGPRVQPRETRPSPPPRNAQVNERETAAQLSVSVQLLRKWRATGQGPRFVKLGKCVRYRSEDIETFVESRRVVEPATPLG